MKHKLLKRAAGLLLSAVLVCTSLAGCSQKSGEEAQSPAPGGSTAGASEQTGGDGADGERAMGRFLEEEVDTTVVFGNIYDMKKMEDGSIRIIGSDGDIGIKCAWESKDSGKTWEKLFEFPAEIQDSDNGYIDYAGLSTDGQAVCAYNEIGDNGIKTVLYLLDSAGAGTRIPFELPNQGGEGQEGGISNMILGVCFAGRDQVLVKDISDNIYQVAIADGSIKQTYEFDGSGESHQVFSLGGKMMVLTNTEALVYDVETGEQQPAEEALQKSVAEHGIFQAVDTTDEGESAFYLTREGLFRYKFGGSVVEQLVEGNMTSMGAPAFYPIALAVLDEQNFLVAANDSNSSSATGISVLKYTYSPDTPAKPEKELKVYSLYDNREMRQSISRFQKEHTDIFVNYQTALAEESGMNVSDALKTLTTEIMAGKGPDLLILDGMPVKTYIEKGILKDMSGVVAKGDGEYFENILNAYQDAQGQLCAVPARFQIPLIQAGSANYTPGEDFTSFMGRKGVLANMEPGILVEKFWYTCGAAWQKEDGTLDAAKITEFLTKLKEAYGEYDSSMENEDTTVGITTVGSGADISEELKKLSFGYEQYDLAFGRRKVCVGLCGDLDYGMMNAVNEKLEQGAYGVMPGQAEKVFVPAMILGISSKSSQPETAEEFAAYLFSKDSQKINQREGLPVEKEAFRSVVDGHQYSGKESLMMGGGTSPDEYLSYEMAPTPEEEVKKFTELAESLTTPALRDDVIKEAVREYGEKVLKGEASPQEASNGIMQKVNIYLAE